MKQLSGFEVHFVVREMQELEGGKVDKIYQPQRDEFLVRVFVTGVGKKLIRIAPPTLCYITSVKRESPIHPYGFVMLLRKKLGKARLQQVRQLKMERIVELVFTTSEERFILIVELFSKGNCILCDADYNIIQPHTAKVWRDRTIKARHVYQPPPPRPSLKDLTEAGFVDLLGNSGKNSVVKCLAVDCGLGGTYAEEVCHRAGVDKESAPAEVQEMAGSLLGAIRELLEQTSDPMIVRRQEELVDIVPFPLSQYEDSAYTAERYETYNAALDAHFSTVIKQESKRPSGKEKKRQRLQSIIDNQQEVINHSESAIEEDTARANAIYSRYQELSELQHQIHSAEGYCWEEIKERVEQLSFVEKLDLKDKRLHLDL